MVAIIKIKILLYAGTCDIVGGDTKYFCNLVNSVEESESFNLIVAGDQNEPFQKRVKQWIRKGIGITYLPTRPILGKHSAFTPIDKLVSRTFFSRPLSKYFDLLVHLLFFGFLRDFVHNFFVFNRLFKENKDVQIFHCNSGNFPGRIAGIAGIFAARVNGCSKIIMTIHNESGLIIDPMSYIYDLIVRSYCTHLIPVSLNVEKSLLNKKRFKSYQINRISIGLDDRSRFLSEDLKPLDGAFRIIIVGNFEERRKGHEPLFYALSELVKTHPHVKLLIVGSGSSGRKATLNKLAEVLAIEANLEWLGYLEDIDEVLLSSALLVVPSTGPEAIPYTIVEGLRAGKPIITSNMGGCSEAVVDNFNGFVLDPGNTKNMAAKLAELADDDDKLRVFGQNSRVLFLKKFDQKTKIKAHLDLYRISNSKTMH